MSILTTFIFQFCKSQSQSLLNPYKQRRYHVQNILKMLPKNHQSPSMNSVKLQDTKLIHRNLLHFYTLTMNDQKEKLIPFKITTKRIKYLGINLPNELKDLYSENYKRLMEETENFTRQKDTLCSRIGRINIFKMTLVPKGMHRFSAFLI